VGGDRQTFYASSYQLTTGYLARATVNSVLRLGHLDTACEEGTEEEACRVS
jgi:hypothetical protein